MHIVDIFHCGIILSRIPHSTGPDDVHNRCRSSASSRWVIGVSDGDNCSTSVMSYIGIDFCLLDQIKWFNFGWMGQKRIVFRSSGNEMDCQSVYELLKDQYIQEKLFVYWSPNLIEVNDLRHNTWEVKLETIINYL